MPPKGPQTRAIRPKNRWKPRQMSQLQGYAYPGRHPKNWSSPENLPGACAIAHGNGVKQPFSEKRLRRPLPTRSTDPSDVLLVGVAVLFQATFVEIERNFLDLKTGSSRVLRGTKCPQKVPRCAP